MTITAVNTDIEFAAGAYGRSGRVDNIDWTGYLHIKAEERPKSKAQDKRTPEIPIPERDRCRSRCPEFVSPVLTSELHGYGPALEGIRLGSIFDRLT